MPIDIDLNVDDSNYEESCVKDDAERIKPFLKWAGGKFKLIPILRKKFPREGKRFVEPFLGGGSVVLNVSYPAYLVNDINIDLIQVWKHFSKLGREFVDKCENLFVPANNSEAQFNQLRTEFNSTKDTLRKAVLFIYLNRHCFNGLCRYNGNGKYNVPFGEYPRPYFPRREFEACLAKVQQFRIESKDFREIFEQVTTGDVVYCDPPYFPSSDSASFNSYSPGGFSFKDQLELAACAFAAAKKGAVVVVSNHYNWYSRQLYVEMYGAKFTRVVASRTISSKTEKRNPVNEIIAVFGG